MTRGGCRGGNSRGAAEVTGGGRWGSRWGGNLRGAARMMAGGCWGWNLREEAEARGMAT